MKNPIVDHFFTKISERGSLALGAAQSKLQEVNELTHIIQQSEGSDAARNILADGMIALALQRCVEFHEGDSRITEKDMHIYYSYAYREAKRSEETIDLELSSLGL